MHFAKFLIFSKFWPLPFFCTVFSTICGTVVEENEKNRGIEIRFFGTPWPILRLREGRNFGSECVSQNNSFCHVLSVSVVPSVSVESVIESVIL